MDIVSVIQVLRQQGYVKISSYIEASQLNELVSEMEYSFKIEKLRMDYSIGSAAVIRNSFIEIDEFPAIKKVFLSENFNRVCKHFFKEASYSLCEDIFLVKDIVGSKHHANDLHFDVKHTLKFYIYLTDSNEQNGAFRCVPGSHKWTEDFRKKNVDLISYENREISRNLPNLGEEISVDGKAGDLIIFDTNMFHRAGKVSKGERLVIRGHSRKIETESLLKKILKSIKLDKYI